MMVNTSLFRRLITVRENRKIVRLNLADQESYLKQMEQITGFSKTLGAAVDEIERLGSALAGVLSEKEILRAVHRGSVCYVSRQLYVRVFHNGSLVLEKTVQDWFNGCNERVTVCPRCGARLAHTWFFDVPEMRQEGVKGRPRAA